MKKATCGLCSKEHPLGQMFAADQQTLCGPCAETAISGPGAAGRVTRLVDNTICGNCHEDCGRDELPLVAGVPMCRKCTEFFRHRPFPVWVQAAAVGLAALVLFGMWRSVRFVEGYLAIKRADTAYEAGDFERAHAEMAYAVDQVPEEEEFQTDEVFFRGVQLMQEDKNEEALVALKEARFRMGKKPAAALDRYILITEGSAAFDRKDYNTFLSKAQDDLRLADDAQSRVALASALACKYALTGDETYKTQALAAMARAKSQAATEKADLGDFEERFQYRLTSREIIDAKEYHKRFPKPEAKAAP